MSTDSKKVNASVMNFAMRYGVLKIRRELREEFDAYPEDPNGVEIKYSDLEEKLELLISDGLGYVEELLGATPEIDEDDLDAYKEDLDTKEEIEVASGELVQRETFKTNWDVYRNRQVAFMRREVAYYGVPMEYTLSSNGKSQTIRIEHLNSKDGFTSFEGMSFGGDNPNKAEFIAPTDFTDETTVTVRFNKWGTNDATTTTQKVTETHTTKYATDTGRQYAWMNKHGSEYVFPLTFIIERNGNTKTIVVPKEDEVQIGSGKYTVVDDLHYNSENHDKANFMLPKSYGVNDICKVTITSQQDTQQDTQLPDSKYNSIHIVKNIRKVGDRTWERFGKTVNQPGSIFGKNITVKWPECGYELLVPNGAFDYAPQGSGGAAWICGTMSPANESQGETGGVWGPTGCKATYYEIHYNK